MGKKISLDDIFVNRKKEKIKKDFFSKAMIEGWSYQKFQEEARKKRKR